VLPVNQDAFCVHAFQMADALEDQERNFCNALKLYFSEAGFVSFLPVATRERKSFLAVCTREMVDDASRPVAMETPFLRLMLSDCLGSIFCASLHLKELEEIRQDAGMAGFAWDVFIRLLSAALREEDGCSAVVDVKDSDNSSSSDGSHKHCHLQLALRFQLEFAALTGRINVDETVRAPQVTLDDGAYHEEFRNFVFSAVLSAQGKRPSKKTIPTLEAYVTKMTEGATEATTLQTVTTTSPTVMTTSSPAMTTSPRKTAAADYTLERQAESASVSTPSSRPVIKKRQGAVIDPVARRMRRGGANPFQLQR